MRPEKWTALALSLVVLCAGAQPAAAAPLQLTSWDKVLDPLFSVLQSEWWYTIGFLNGANQRGEPRRFAFMVSVVRSADLYKLPLPLVFAATDMQISLLDLDKQTHLTSDEVTEFPDLETFSTAAKSNKAHVATRGDSGDGGTLEAHFRGGGPGFSLDFAVEPAKAQAAFGNNGTVDNDSLGKAVYVSRTRQRVMAPSKLTIGDETVDVTGLAWEDHQLSEIAPFDAPIRWDWFAVLLNDGTEVMAYQIVDAASGSLLKNYAGHVLGDGQVENLDGQLAVKETAFAPYGDQQIPSAWSLSLPSIFQASIDWIVPLPDIPVTAGQIKGAYFEGPCRVQGDGGQVAAAWAEHFDGRLYSGVVAPRL
jgi:predicted secreted hydrolase